MKNPVILHLPLSLPKTGIMVTIGKASSDDAILRRMAQAGATVFRFNAAQFKPHNGSYHVECKGGSRPVEEVIDAIRRLEVDLRRPLLTYLDLAGPKLRVQEVRGGKDSPKLEDSVRIYLDRVAPEKRGRGSKDLCLIYVRDAELKRFPQGKISFKDGLLVIDIKKVERDENGYDYCEGKVSKVADNFKWLVREGVRGANVGCNPVGYIFPEIITPYDHEVIEWGVNAGVDVFSQSFVCHPIDAFRLRCVLAQKFAKDGLDPALALEQTIIGKIETAPAVKPENARSYASTIFGGPENAVTRLLGFYHLPTEPTFQRLEQRFKDLCRSYLVDPIVALAEAFDGLMVARGDLAVEIEKVDVPNIQRRIADECRVRSKAVIIATEVLVSMQLGRPSTRAEVGDINNAVFQEADIIMLGGEVASMEGSRFTPDQVVRELNEAITAAEIARKKEDEARNFETRQLLMEKLLPQSDPDKGNHEDFKEKLSMGARICNAARTKDSPAIFASVSTGATASYIADFSPRQPIVAITSKLSVARRLLLYQGVYPVTIRMDFDHTVEAFVDILLDCHSRFYRDGTWPARSVICPALLRIESAERALSKSNDQPKSLRPNTLLDITLPERAEEVRETEWKLLLSKESHSRLRNVLVNRYNAVEVNQQNTYFTDQSRRLFKKKISLRLRLEESRTALQKRKKKSSSLGRPRVRKQAALMRITLHQGLKWSTT